MKKLSTINKNNIVNMLLYAAILIPFFVFVWHVYKYATNMPRQDDYDAILVFVTLFKNADWHYKVELLLMQHNEHRILLSRVVFALYYYIFGEINFRHIIFIDGIVLLLLFLNISFFIRQALPTLWKPAVLVLSMCLFDLSSFENMNFAMAGMQNYGVILMFTASIFFYSRKHVISIAPAMLMQVLCVYSSGNGNIGAGLIVLYTILARNKRGMIASIFAFVLFSPLYYYHFTKPGSDFFTLDPNKFIPFFLHSVGTHFSYTWGIAAAGLLLAVLASTIPIGRGLKIERNVLPLVCLAGFALGSLGVMSIFRGNLPLWASNASRYYIYSHMLTAICFTFLAINMQKEPSRNLLLGGIIFGLFFSYRWNCNEGAGGFKALRNELKTMNYHYPDQERAKKIADESCNEGVYCIEKHRADKMPFEK